MSKELEEIEQSMFEDFQLLGKQQQIRLIMLASNAEFVIRMLGTPNRTNEVGKAAATILKGLTRFVRPAATNG